MLVMKYKILIVALFIALLFLAPVYASASSYYEVELSGTSTLLSVSRGVQTYFIVSIGVAAPSISNAPEEKDFGIVELNTTSSTIINFFIIINTSDVAVDVDIQGGSLTGGGDTWTLSDNATVGENIYGLKAGLDDADDNFDIVVMNSLYELISNLDVSDNQSWGLQILMPSTVADYDMQQMSDNVTLAVSAH